MMDKRSAWRTRWQAIEQGWRKRVEQGGLTGVAETIEVALQPLTPVLTQLLWAAQPGFAMFGEAEAIDVLVEYLEGEVDPPSEHSSEG